MDAYFKANRANWDERVAIHVKDQTGLYRMADFRAGVDTLFPVEAAEIGDVSGQRLVHLQCHFGKDTLVLARRGATVTGLDFSTAAIAAARALAEEVAVPATFVEGNVYDAPDLVGRAAYDVAYVTWGAINWLPDIVGWAQTVADVLKPGGRLYLAETHPTILAFEEIDGLIQPGYAYQTPKDQPIADDTNVTYTGAPDLLAARRTYEWIHPVSAILTALSSVGLRLTFFHEHEVLPYRLFPMMIEGEAPDQFVLPPSLPRLPLAFSLGAVKFGG